MENKRQVAVLFGAGSIGQAIIRRIGVGKHIVLADISDAHAAATAQLLENAGYECSTIKADLVSKADILIDGGTTASYWYGDLQYLKSTQ